MNEMSNYVQDNIDLSKDVFHLLVNSKMHLLSLICDEGIDKYFGIENIRNNMKHIRGILKENNNIYQIYNKDVFVLVKETIKMLNMIKVNADNFKNSIKDVLVNINRIEGEFLFFNIYSWS